MQTKISTLILKQAIESISKNLERNPGLKFGEIIYMYVKDRDLKLRTTNLETAIEISIPISESKEWICTIPGYVFESVVNSLEGETTTISYEKKLMTITSENNISSINTIGMDEDYPEIPKIDGKTGEIEKEEIIKGLKSVIHATSKNITKIEFTGIYCFTEEGENVFVATDSIRLSEQRFDNKLKSEINFIIPRKQAATIIKVFEKSEDTKLKIVQGSNGIIISNKNTIFYTKIIEGEFPNYKNLIPSKFDAKVVVSKFDLSNFIKKARFFSNTNNSIEFKIEQNKLILKAKKESVGETEEIIEGAEIEGMDLSVSFNHVLISEAIPSVESDNLIIYLSKDLSTPMKITGTDTNKFNELLMPILT